MREILARLRRLLSTPGRLEAQFALASALLNHLVLSELRSTERFREEKRLLKHGFSVHSQTDEDGILQEIFRRVDVTSRRFVEIGVEDGLECNTAFLLIQGWKGAWVEGDPVRATGARRNYKDYPVEIRTTYVTAENADALVDELAAGEELDLLSIDIDFNDYWVWRAIESSRPRVVVIEYNALFPPPTAVTVPYDPKGHWDGSCHRGASLSALTRLGEEKGYHLVGCGLDGINAYFVRSDLSGNLFASPYTAENHYEPLRRLAVSMKSGRPAIGPWVQV